MQPCMLVFVLWRQPKAQGQWSEGGEVGETVTPPAMTVTNGASNLVRMEVVDEEEKATAPALIVDGEASEFCRNHKQPAAQRVDVASLQRGQPNGEGQPT